MDIIQQIMTSATAGFYGAIVVGGFVSGLAVLILWWRLIALLVESFVDFWRG